MSKVTIIIDDEATRFSEPRKVTIEMPEICTLANAVETFELALRCCGFCFKGKLEIVEESEAEVEE